MRLKLYLSRYDWNTNFLWNGLLHIQHTYSSEFFMGQSTSKTAFDMAWSCTVIFLLMSTLFWRCIFQFRKRKKAQVLMSKEHATFAQLRFLKNCSWKHEFFFFELTHLGGLKISRLQSRHLETSFYYVSCSVFNFILILLNPITYILLVWFLMAYSPSWVS